MHLWLGRSVDAVLSDNPPGSAGIFFTDVDPNGLSQKRGDCNLRVSLISCRACDPARSAFRSSGDLAAGTVPIEAIFWGMVSFYIFVVERPHVPGGCCPMRHTIGTGTGSASAVMDCRTIQRRHATYLTEQIWLEYQVINRPRYRWCDGCAIVMTNTREMMRCVSKSWNFQRRK